MHKLESFALSVGSKIDKPQIETCFYPVVDKQFICISKESSAESKKYDFFDDVIFHIKPYLDKQGISIIEIGKSEDAPVFYTKDLRALNRMQSNFVLNKSLLYFGNLNFYSHVASHFNKPTVCPIRNDYIDSIKPYWSKNESCILLKKDTKLKPSFLDKENPKTINDVKPEAIASNILDLLKIDHQLSDISTIFTGPQYNNSIVDLIPGNYNPAQISLPKTTNIRMDKSFNYNFLLACSKLKNLILVTDKVIDKRIHHLIKDCLSQVTFFVNKDTTNTDIDSILSIGKPVLFFCKDKKNIKDIRLKFLDHDIAYYSTLTKKDLNHKDLKELKFLSKRNIIHEGSPFNSYLSMSQGKNVSKPKDCKEFWEDLSFCRVYKEKS